MEYYLNREYSLNTKYYLNAENCTRSGVLICHQTPLIQNENHCPGHAKPSLNVREISEMRVRGSGSQCVPTYLGGQIRSLEWFSDSKNCSLAWKRVDGRLTVSYFAFLSENRDLGSWPKLLQVCERDNRDFRRERWITWVWKKNVRQPDIQKRHAS